MLPSPACPTTPISTSCSAAIRSTPSSSAASWLRGTTTSSRTRPPLPAGKASAAYRSIAGSASRRAWSSAAASTASVAVKTSSAPVAVQAAASRARSAGARAPVSTAASSSARASVRNPIGWYASIARSWVWSSSSSRLGESPRAEISATAAPAAAVEGKTATMVSDSSGAGRSETVISVITPRVPSDPTKSRVRS